MIEIELTNYRAYKFINIERHSCPLAFYKVNKNYFPILSKLANMLYCSPATSVPSECMFSTAGLVFNHKRNRLKPYLAEQLIMLKKMDFNIFCYVINIFCICYEFDYKPCIC